MHGTWYEGVTVPKPLDGWELLTATRRHYAVAGSVTLHFAQSYQERVTLLNIGLTKSAELLTEALCAVMGTSVHSTDCSIGLWLRRKMCIS